MSEKNFLHRINPQLLSAYKLETEAMKNIGQDGILDYATLLELRASLLAESENNRYDIFKNSKINFKEIYIDNCDGHDLELRIYEPIMRKETMPVLMYFHGGGCVLGSAKRSDETCAELSLKCNCIVINIDYRLAPEYPAPAAQLDGYIAWKWLCEHGANLLNADLEHSIIYGVSGGSAIALGLTLRLLDDNYRLPTSIVLLCPMLDDRNNTQAKFEFAKSSMWSSKYNDAAWNFYKYGLGKEKLENICSYTVPGRRENFTGLPQVFVNIGELDIFRDDVLDFVVKLTKCSVPVEFTLYPGCYHNFEKASPDADISKTAQRQLYDYIKRIFYT